MEYQRIRFVFVGVIIFFVTCIGDAANGASQEGGAKWYAGLNIGTITFMAPPQETKFIYSVDLIYKIKPSWAFRSVFGFIDTRVDYTIHPSYMGQAVNLLSFQLG